MGAASLFVLTPALASAQPAAAPVPSASTSAAADTAIGEVVVTSRFRKERLNSVPIAVSVIDAKAAATKNLNDLETLSQTIPTVDFRSGASNKDRTVFIRGIGTISTSPGVEPSVSTVIDGVVLSRPGQSTLDLVDVDRIEVLRGPQGTLFGKNASAGVINIITQTPRPEFHGYLDGSFYEGAEYRLKAAASGTLVPDKVLGLVDLLYAHYDGNVRNIYDGTQVNGYDHWGAHGKLLITPSSNLTVTLNADFVRSHDTTPTGVFVATSTKAYPTNIVAQNPNLAANLTAAGITPSSDNRTIDDNTPSHVNDDNGGVSGQVDWNVGSGFTVTSISAFRSWTNRQLQDYDQTAKLSPGVPSAVDNGKVIFRQFSEELRLTSPKGGFLDYVAGAYFLRAEDRETYTRNISILTAGVDNTTFGDAVYGTNGDNYALYGEANLNFTKTFRAIVGVRGIYDDLDYFHNRTSFTNGALATVDVSGVRVNHTSAGSVDKTGVSGRAGLQYDLTPETMVYFTYSRGYKGPAYNVYFNMYAHPTPNTLPPGAPPVDEAPLKPETSNAYEVGLKGGFFERRLQASVDIYQTDFTNYQANFADTVGTPPTTVTRLINAGAVSTRGVEGDFSARLSRQWNAAFAFAYDDAKVDKFNCPAVLAPAAAASCNVNGKVLPFAPKWKLDVSTDYTIPLSGPFDLQLSTDYNYKTKTQYSLSETPDTVQGAYGIWNAGVALLGKDNGWQLRAIAKNLTDQHYSSYIARGSVGGVVRFVPRDDNRYFGVNVRKDF
jgi:iron complex outermembrane receptor protein